MKFRAPVLLVGTLILGVALGWTLKPGPSIGLSEAVRQLSGTNAADFSLLPRVWNAIHSDYVDATVDDTKLLSGMLSGLVLGLGDPYSEYLAPSDAAAFDQELTGEVDGIGAEVGSKDGRTVIIAPLPGSPAEAAGVKAGDRILSIDGTDSANLSLDEAVKRIRGPVGTTVKLMLETPGSTPRAVSITRQKIRIESVTVSTVDGASGTGPILVVRLRSFTESTGRDMVRLLTPHLSPKPSGLVLDLRDNPGGYLTTAIDVASQFLQDGAVVSEVGRDGKRTEHRVNGKPLLPETPMVVLVNRGSASAAEIVAGALQDPGRARVLGEQSFGKGSVQTLSGLPNGGDLKLTVARWYTPKGRSIDKQGITPDLAVAERTEGDAALDAALAELRTG